MLQITVVNGNKMCDLLLIMRCDHLRSARTRLSVLRFAYVLKCFRVCFLKVKFINICVM